MSYTPTDWKTGDVITADKLNNIEQGIVNAGSDFVVNATVRINDDSADTSPAEIDKPFSEIVDAINNKRNVIILADIIRYKSGSDIGRNYMQFTVINCLFEQTLQNINRIQAPLISVFGNDIVKNMLQIDSNGTNSFFYSRITVQ